MINAGFRRGLVALSASFLSVGNYVTSASFQLTRIWTFRSRTSICSVTFDEMGTFATVLEVEHNFVLYFLKSVSHVFLTAYIYTLNDTAVLPLLCIQH
jgi:hypothetical protein